MYYRALKLLLGVMSNHTNVNRRALIRRTWMPQCRGSCEALFVVRRLFSAAEPSADMIVLSPENESLRWLRFSTYNSPMLPWFKYAFRYLPHADFVAKVDDDALIYPAGLLADLRAHRPDLYGAVEWSSYRLPNRFTTSEMEYWGGTYRWAEYRKQREPKLIGPFSFLKGPAVVVSRRAVGALLGARGIRSRDRRARTGHSCLEQWEYRVTNHRQIYRRQNQPPPNTRILDDVSFGLFTWKCLNATPIKVVDIGSQHAFIEYRRWHTYPNETAALRVVHMGYVLKPSYLKWYNGSATCADRVWAKTAHGRLQPVVPLPIACGNCAKQWEAPSHMQPLWTCCSNRAPRLKTLVRAAPAGWKPGAAEC